MSRPIVALIGPGEGASDAALEDAATVARGVAARGWITLTGGRAAGVMGVAARAAAEAGGVVIGLLPGASRAEAAPELTVAVATGLGEARNAVIATAADAVVACGMNAGTAAEVALAIRAGRPVVLVRPDEATSRFFATLRTAPTPREASAAPLEIASDADAVLAWLVMHLGHAGPEG